MADRLTPGVSMSEMRTLIAISETGSLTAAANALGISQPGVSRQLARLEQRLGVLLLERDCQRPRFTRAGEHLLAYARETVAGFDRLMSSLKCEGDDISGELRLEASAPYCLSDWAKEFESKNPNVKINLLFADSQSVEEDVLDGTADLGLTPRWPVHKTLCRRVVGRDEVVLAVPAHHPFAGRKEIAVEELRDQPFVTCDYRSSNEVSPVKEALRRRGLQLPERRFVMSLSSDQECLRAVRQGVGLSWVTSALFEREDVDGAIPVRIKGVRFTRTIYLIHSAKRLRPVGQAFLATLPRAG